LRHTEKRTIILKVDTMLREACLLASEKGRSVSALLNDGIEVMVGERKAFDKPPRKIFARLREDLDLHWTPPNTRDELHER
jgi:hypothetical protein